MSKFFASLDEKRKFLGNFEKFSKFSKDFLKEIAKTHYFSIFSKEINKPKSSIFAVWTKNTLLGNIEKFLKISHKNSIGKLHLNDFLKSCC